MSADDSTLNGRRELLRAATLAAGGLIAGPAIAQTGMSGHAMPGGGMTMPMDVPMMGVFGKASAGPGRATIAILVYPNMIMQDFVGPLTVFNLMHSEIHLVWKDPRPVMTEVGIPVLPSTSFADCPRAPDVLFVPGGLEGTIEVMQDPAVLSFLADRGRDARFVTSDCTGSLVLGAAGLLRGYKATSHWYVRDQLALMGAIPTHERVVHDRNRITGGGVTAGIDFALTVCAALKGIELAQRIQLTIEYAPKPPFNAGEPETAPKAIVDNLFAARKPSIDRARAAAAIAGGRFR